MALASMQKLKKQESIHEKGKECPMNVYELLMSQLPQMYPFEDDSVEDCVRMELSGYRTYDRCPVGFMAAIVFCFMVIVTGI